MAPERSGFCNQQSKIAVHTASITGQDTPAGASAITISSCTSASPFFRYLVTGTANGSPISRPCQNLISLPNPFNHANLSFSFLNGLFRADKNTPTTVAEFRKVKTTPSATASALNWQNSHYNNHSSLVDFWERNSNRQKFFNTGFKYRPALGSSTSISKNSTFSPFSAEMMQIHCYSCFAVPPLPLNTASFIVNRGLGHLGCYLL